VVGHEHSIAGRGDLTTDFPFCREYFLEEVVGQFENVAATLAKRRHIDREDVMR